MSAKKSLSLDNYEQGLLISAVNKALNGENDFSPDDVAKLKELKTKLQELAGLKH